MGTDLQDALAIRKVVEDWAVWRDAGDWERFRTVWHDDGWMSATWFQGPAADFIRVTREGWDKGVSILHFLGGSAIEVAGDRAIAQTKMTISQRGLVEGVLCDVVCTGRFHDFVQTLAIGGRNAGGSVDRRSGRGVALPVGKPGGGEQSRKIKIFLGLVFA